MPKPSTMMLASMMVAGTAVVGGAANADSPPLQTETVALHYFAHGALIETVGTLTECPGFSIADDCFPLTPPSWAQYVTITSADNNTSLPVPIVIGADPTPGTGGGTGGSAGAGPATVVCGSINDWPIPSDPNGLLLSVYSATVHVDRNNLSQPPCVGAATQGTITVEYRNQP